MRWLLVGVLGVVVVVVLFTLVFPRVERLIDSPTLDGSRPDPAHRASVSAPSRL